LLCDRTFLDHSLKSRIPFASSLKLISSVATSTHTKGLQQPNARALELSAPPDMLRKQGIIDSCQHIPA
jgi:hypothetical protein